MSNIIAMVWDFDKTLINGYMEDPLLIDYGIDPKNFWAEVSALPEKYFKTQGVKVNPDTIYLNQMIRYVKSGKFAGLNNAKLREYGNKLNFYNGVPEIFELTKNFIEGNEKYQASDIKLEHYIISSGLTEIIRGSKINEYVAGIWGCEFIEVDDVIGEVAYTIDNTTKTRALFEIQKGVGKTEGVQVNTSLPEEYRRVQFSNMVYIADGPSDIPAFSVINKNGGATFAVYPAGDIKAMKQVEQLRKEKRVQFFAEADYSANKTACMWLCNTIEEFAEKILADEKKKLSPYTDRQLPRY
ncbi:MAG: haloacid dehalogenase-like hydrolase [Selenomonadaceae bacterium]|nr:haloacid dehalogenase-like hydrolase [Selenomonadaceae bacterium]